MSSNDRYIDEILEEVEQRRNRENVVKSVAAPVPAIESPYITFRDVFDWVESIIIPVIFIVIFMLFGFRINQVFGISMEPTLYEGQRLIVTPYGKLTHGDIVILEAKNLLNRQTGLLGEPIVKRIIGLPGDEIYIESGTGNVYRNNVLLEENYINEKLRDAGNREYPLIVPDNHIFVMGDNRNHSVDSRSVYYEGTPGYVDCVDVRYVLGRAVFRIWPLDSIGELN